MTLLQGALGVLIGFASGMLSGLFGVGGGIVMTPGIQVLLGTSPIVALATPLPVIFPTAITGAYTYGRAGELDTRAAAWIVGPGVLAAILGSWLTDVVDPHLLLLVTAVLLAIQSANILRGARTTTPAGSSRAGSPLIFAGIGAAAGFISGLLGIGGGLIIVPLLAGLLGMPLKRALGTSLLAIVALVIPGTVVHTGLGHINWAVFTVVALGAVPGVRLGARLALGARERTLRVLVGVFLLVVAVAYGLSEFANLVRA